MYSSAAPGRAIRPAEEPRTITFVGQRLCGACMCEDPRDRRHEPDHHVPKTEGVLGHRYAVP